MKSIKNYTLLLLIFQTCLIASAQVDVFEADIIPAQKPAYLDIYLLPVAHIYIVHPNNVIIVTH